MATATRSVIMGGLRGKAGSVVFVQLPDGSVQIRERIIPDDPRTPLQTEWRRAVRTAAGQFRKLDETQYQLWAAFARKQNGGPSYNAASAFTSFAARLYRLHGFDFPVPMTPPAGTFLGDIVAVTVTSAAGAVIFTPSSSNRPGVTTELGLGRLKSRFQNLRDRDIRHAGFTTFGGPVTVPTQAGDFQAAVRFIDSATGEATDWIRVGRVHV